MLGEFEQIAQIMAPLAAKAEGAFALKNDAAVFTCAQGEEIVVTTDTLIAGVHFFADDTPQDIAHKLIGVNLSDLAAMGATPRHYTLNASYPKGVTTEWIKAFAQELSVLQDRYDIVLLGGDTTRTPGPLTLSLTAFGTVGKGKALPRQGARPGDLLCVSGTIGDGALGLLVRQGKLADTSGHLLSRYLRPTPRVELGKHLVSIARTCLDISDGLATDCAHMEIGADIHLADIPLSTAAQQTIKEDSSLVSAILNGGDDYELMFSVPSARKEELTKLSHDSATPITIIGRITDKNEIRILQADGTQLTDFAKGYRHF